MWLWVALALGFSILRGGWQPKVIYGEWPANVLLVCDAAALWLVTPDRRSQECVLSRPTPSSSLAIAPSVLAE